ncbi:hypothetical protein EJB05_36027, partial [Eragrostis curvula]
MKATTAPSCNQKQRASPSGLLQYVSLKLPSLDNDQGNSCMFVYLRECASVKQQSLRRSLPYHHGISGRRDSQKKSLYNCMQENFGYIYLM